MKRLVLIAALVLAGFQCWSQTMDTIRWYERKPDLYYWGSNWVDSNTMAYPNERLNRVHNLCTGYYIDKDRYVGRACYTENPLQIIGVAAPVLIVPNEYNLFSDRLPEYFIVYQYENDTVIFKAETRWDTVTPHEKMEFAFYNPMFGSNDPFDSITNSSLHRDYINLYEAYFDKPVMVHDTFFVGGTSHNNLIYGDTADGVAPVYALSPAFPMTEYTFIGPTINCTANTLIPNPSFYVEKYYRPNDSYIQGGCYEMPTQPDTGGFGIDTSIFYFVDIWLTNMWPVFFAIFDTNFVSTYGSCMERKTMGLHVADIDSAAVGLTWDDSGVEAWQVEVKPVGTDSGMLFSTPINYLQVTGLDTGVWYVARARTQCDTDLFGSWSDTLLFYVPRHSCNTPTWFHVAALDSGSVTLAWNNAPVLSWKVMMGLVDLGMTNAQTTTVTTNSLHVEGLYGDCWYWARVRALCDTDWYSEWTDTIHFLVPNQHPSGPDTTTAINPVEQYTYLMPNPAKEEVAVMSSFKVRSVELYASDGKLLKEQEVNAIGTRLSLEGLPAGVYFVRVRTTAGVTTKRLVIE